MLVFIYYTLFVRRKLKTAIKGSRKVREITLLKEKELKQL